jgi:hypothetical protein
MYVKDFIGHNILVQLSISQGILKLLIKEYMFSMNFDLVRNLFFTLHVSLFYRIVSLRIGMR